MPAIHTEDHLTTYEPRIQLPSLDYLTVPAVREAAQNFLRLHRDRDDARAAVDRARRAVQDAEDADARDLSAALLDGSREPKLRARTVRAEATVREAEARRDAYDRAVSMAHARLRDAVVEHAPEWLESVTADRADATRRYEEAAAELTRAHRDLVNVGSVASWLRDHPQTLTVGTYRPSVELSLVVAPLAEALAVVRADERANAPVPATAEDDEPEIAV